MCVNNVTVRSASSPLTDYILAIKGLGGLAGFVAAFVTS